MGKLTKRKLGRGLEALLPQSDVEDNFKYLSPDSIEANPYQVREKEDVEDLIPSVKEHGILQPLLVRQVNGRYMLIAGARRLKAAKEVGLEKVPAYILNVDDKKAMALTLIENLKREDLNPIEVAQGYRRLVEEFGFTHEEVARVFGKDRSTITNSLRLLRLSEFVQSLIKEGKISEGHARLLVGLPEPLQKMVAAEIIKKQLSVRETEVFIRKLKNRKSARKSSVEKIPSALLGKEVYLQKGKRGGKVIIKFKNNEEYEKLAEILRLGG